MTLELLSYALDHVACFHLGQPLLLDREHEQMKKRVDKPSTPDAPEVRPLFCQQPCRFSPQSVRSQTLTSFTLCLQPCSNLLAAWHLRRPRDIDAGRAVPPRSLVLTGTGLLPASAGQSPLPYSSISASPSAACCTQDATSSPRVSASMKDDYPN